MRQGPFAEEHLGGWFPCDTSRHWIHKLSLTSQAVTDCTMWLWTESRDLAAAVGSFSQARMLSQSTCHDRLPDKLKMKTQCSTPITSDRWVGSQQTMNLFDEQVPAADRQVKWQTRRHWARLQRCWCGGTLLCSSRPQLHLAKWTSSWQCSSHWSV